MLLRQLYNSYRLLSQYDWVILLCTVKYSIARIGVFSRIYMENFTLPATLDKVALILSTVKLAEAVSLVDLI